jgi:aminoglycoside phosphotransferase (APT) family kinase protein
MYGPWTLGKRIYNGGSKSIFEATSTTLHGAEREVKWLVKAKPSDNSEELATTLSLAIEMAPSHMITLPRDPYHRFGITKDAIWYAMKRCDGHLTPEHKDRWQNVGRACLQFLRTLHKTHRRVYMDFRPENILIDGDDFVVTDYETVGFVYTMKTRDANADARWYYMARGAEPDQWLYSWKMDFVSLAYMLITLTCEKPPAICHELMERRKGSRQTHESMRSLAKRRNVAMYEVANPVMKKYLDILREVKWNTWEPPPYMIYSRLEELFV